MVHHSSSHLRRLVVGRKRYGGKDTKRQIWREKIWRKTRKRYEYGGKDTMRKIWREKKEEKMWWEVRYGTVRYDPIVSIRAAGLIKYVDIYHTVFHDP
jgi:hypothetical protein